MAVLRPVGAITSRFRIVGAMTGGQKHWLRGGQAPLDVWSIGYLSRPRYPTRATAAATTGGPCLLTACVVAVSVVYHLVSRPSRRVSVSEEIVID